MVANWTQVRRTGLAQVGTALLVLAAACGGGGRDGSAVRSSSSSTSSSAPATTTTVAVTTTTLSAEEQVKAAYLEYWEVVDQVLADPASGGEPLRSVATDPLLSFVLDDVSTDAGRGYRQFTPADRTSSHRIDAVQISGASASITDCFVDARVVYGPAGETVDDAIVSKTAHATLVPANGGWLVSDLVFGERSDGSSRCAA